jgi:hypothetical protein
LQISDLNVPTRWFVFYLHGMTASAESYSSTERDAKRSEVAVDWGFGLGIGVRGWDLIRHLCVQKEKAFLATGGRARFG